MSLKTIFFLFFLFFVSFGEEIKDSTKNIVADTTKLNNTDSTIKSEAIEESDTVNTISNNVDSTASDSVSEIAAKQDSIVGYGKITISSNPESTALYFDDELKGHTPITIDSIIPGKHSLKLKRSGYYVKKASVNVKAGSSANINLDLIKPSTLKVNSSIVNAVISLNGKMVGQTPFNNSKLKPDKYEISIQAPGFEMQDTTLTLTSGSVDSLYFNFGETVEKKSDREESKAVEKSEPEEKTKLQRILNKVAIGVFCAFTAMILLIELNQNND